LLLSANDNIFHSSIALITVFISMFKCDTLIHSRRPGFAHRYGSSIRPTLAIACTPLDAGDRPTSSLTDMTDEEQTTPASDQFLKIDYLLT